MSYCRNCGNELNEQSKFCPRCGTKVNILDDNSNKGKVNFLKDKVKSTSDAPLNYEISKKGIFNLIFLIFIVLLSNFILFRYYLYIPNNEKLNVLIFAPLFFTFIYILVITTIIFGSIYLLKQYKKQFLLTLILIINCVLFALIQLSIIVLIPASNASNKILFDTVVITLNLMTLLSILFNIFVVLRSILLTYKRGIGIWFIKQ